VRGGGGNFGVVTSFEYQLYPVGPLLAGLVFYPLDKAKDILRFYHEFASNAPDELITDAALLHLPDGVPAAAIGVCYNGPIAEGEKVIQSLRQVATPLVEQIGPLTYVQVQHMVDAATPEGNQYYEKAHYFRDISDEAIDTLIEHFKHVPSPLSLPFFQHLGNAANRVSPEETAFSHRDARYNLILIADWTDPGESEIHVKWARDLWDALQPYATGGVYVNNIGREADGDGHLIRAAYGPNYPRLAEIKTKYDPTNFFRHNQNIKPT
jgi:FAD/FMN-containing dehydrogenase